MLKLEKDFFKIRSVSSQQIKVEKSLQHKWVNITRLVKPEFFNKLISLIFFPI